MKVLFIGGTGIISSGCAPLAIEQGIDLYLLNRGQTSTRPIPPGAHLLTGDIRDASSARAALGKLEFDAVVDWVAFEPRHIEADLELFRGRTGQYVYISSASAYQKPPTFLPITESTPLSNPYWSYSRNKIACEERLMQAYRSEGFPMTIVRPSHTYDRTLMPMGGGYTVLKRMREGRKVYIPGDGTSLWVMTHHRDFAVGFVGLLGNNHAIGEAFHITGDERLTWNQIYELIARAARATQARFVHVPADLIAAYDPETGPGLIGDKIHSVIFDNTKIKRLVPQFAPSIPFARGAEEIVAWYDGDPTRQRIDAKMDAMMDRVIAGYERAWPEK